MKAKILVLLFLGMLNLQAQTTKKTVTPVKKATPTTTKPATKTTPKTTADVEGIFATITTNKGNIVVQ